MADLKTEDRIFWDRWKKKIRNSDAKSMASYPLDAAGIREAPTPPVNVSTTGPLPLDGAGVFDSWAEERRQADTGKSFC